jgi:hypothetical protein
LTSCKTTEANFCIQRPRKTAPIRKHLSVHFLNAALSKGAQKMIVVDRQRIPGSGGAGGPNPEAVADILELQRRQFSAPHDCLEKPALAHQGRN